MTETGTKNEIITIHDGADICATNLIAKLQTKIAEVWDKIVSKLVEVWDKIVSKLVEVWDKIVPHVWQRWLVTLALTALYFLWVQMFAFPCFFLGFLWQFTLIPALRSNEIRVRRSVEEGFLPIKSSDEFKPFVGCCNEIDLWFHMTTSIFYCAILAWVVDLSVPSLNWFYTLFGWIIEALILGSDVIRDVVNHKYVPFDIGRKKCAGKKVCK